ncbi:hypothetical protein FF098_015285 [Parvularcula flava]|uniref:Lipoprotein n=1 Tax=Aquisalinus luteolus TaxID=1566827 RepID=A0A8J3A6K3_9PROT|nr:hypothetical protein [Aquisalinus luteolus]NHK29281.1 hypothetical protein [Aquisalinus luteolus]GGI01253.1 hypothetical protein GCM10011355_31460 [Aquisalinus luteolus]
MYCIGRLLIVFFSLGALTSGCLMNGVKEINPAKARVSEDRTILVVGVQTEPADQPGYIYFTQYDLEKGFITGNCSSWNRIRETVAPTNDTIIRAYSAPAGFYATSFREEIDAGTRPVSREVSLAFNAPAGSVVYLGDYITTSEAGSVSGRRESNPERAKKVLEPEMAANMITAEPVPIKGGVIVPICTP